MYICYICLSCLLPKINFVDYTTVHVPSSVWLVSLRAILPYSPVTCFFISLRCGWSVIMDPIFAVLSEQFTEAEFLQVDSEECRVQQFKCFVNLCHGCLQFVHFSPFLSLSRVQSSNMVWMRTRHLHSSEKQNYCTR